LGVQRPRDGGGIPARNNAVLRIRSTACPRIEAILKAQFEIVEGLKPVLSGNSIPKLKDGAMSFVTFGAFGIAHVLQDAAAIFIKTCGFQSLKKPF
jgi:hypothetical protein